MTFAEKLKLYRERLDISRSELGRRTGLSRSIISRWERGERSPKIEQLDVLARFFNVDITVEYLLNAYRTAKTQLFD